jgi:hypothetical protein
MFTERGMSNNNDEGKNKGKVAAVLDETSKQRYRLQHEELRKWDRGVTTARQCIDNILDIQKIVFFNRRK